MATESDIKGIFGNWIALATGIPAAKVLWDKQPKFGLNKNAPQPDSPYATYMILGGPFRIGLYDETRNPEKSSTSEQVEISGQRRLIINTQIFDVNAYDLMVDLQNSLQKQTVRDSLKRRQSTIVKVVTILDDTDYDVILNGATITITSDSDATAEEIRDALVDEINLEGIGVTASAEVAVDEFKTTAGIGEDFTIAVDAKMSISSQTNAVDFAVKGDLGIVDVTAFMETAWESRRSMDVEFFSHTSLTEEPGIIETAIMTGDIAGQEFTFEIKE